VRTGPLYMTLAGLMFTVMIYSVRELRADLSAIEIIWWRAAIGAPIAFAMARRVGLSLVGRRLFALRLAFGFAAMTCFYVAAKGLLVADLSILTKLQPIFVAILAPIFLGAGERAGVGVWLLLAAGLAGCGVLLAPDLEIGNHLGLIAMAGALFSAAAHVTVRKLAATDHPRTLVLWFQLGLLGASTIYLVAGPGAPASLPTSTSAIHLLVVGVTANAGQLLMTHAYREDRASLVAAASYSAPVFAVAIDWAAIGVPPTGHVLAGGAIVVGAGLILLFRREAPVAATVTPDD